jgi:energy-coupling factor transporter ATP-binding protein EcfA2
MERATDLAGLIRVFQSEPLRNENFNKFYVDASEARGNDSAFCLIDYFRININKPKKVLFMGHRGCGKSTELERVRKELEPVFFVTTFSIKDEIDTIDLNYIDLIFVILDKLLQALEPHNIEINPDILKNLYDYWHDEKIYNIFKTDKMEADVIAGAKLNFLTAMMFSVKGVLKTGKETKEEVRRIITAKISQLMLGINDLIDNISSRLKEVGKVPILIVEDLDKLDISVAKDLFLYHKNTLTELNIHIIYTFPIFLHYSHDFSEIEQSFDHNEFLYMIKVHNKDYTYHPIGIELIKKIISERSDSDNLFIDGSLEYLIKQSGGALRNLFEMILNASLKSRGRKIDKIDMESAKFAYIKLRSGFERTISRKHVDTLKRIYEDPNKNPFIDDTNLDVNDNLKELLKSLAVIEYNGERWCDLNPAVVDILDSKKIIIKKNIV